MDFRFPISDFRFEEAQCHVDGVAPHAMPKPSPMAYGAGSDAIHRRSPIFHTLLDCVTFDKAVRDSRCGAADFPVAIRSSEGGSVIRSPFLCNGKIGIKPADVRRRNHKVGIRPADIRRSANPSPGRPRPMRTLRPTAS